MVKRICGGGSLADSLLSIVRAVSGALSDGRTLRAIYEHGLGEMDELEVEIARRERGLAAGDDGVVGEAIDVILCKLDIIFLADPNITDEEINDIARLKAAKWLSKARQKLEAAERAVGVSPPP